MKDNDSDSQYSDAFTAKGSFMTFRDRALFVDPKMGPSNDELDKLSILSPTSTPSTHRSLAPKVTERSASVRFPRLAKSALIDPSNDPVRFFFGPGLLMRQVSRMHNLKIEQITDKHESSLSNRLDSSSRIESLPTP